MRDAAARDVDGPASLPPATACFAWQETPVSFAASNAIW